MIEKEKIYVIHGWVVLLIIDILKHLKSQVESNYKNLSKVDFLDTLSSYDSSIIYLLNLKEECECNDGSKHETTYNKNLEDVLKSLNINIQHDAGDKKNES